MEIPRVDRVDTLLSATVRYNLRSNDGIVNAIYSLLDFLDTCPICKKVSSSTTIVGQWPITYISKSVIITILNDLNKLIIRL
uniref:Uncharacterized protein n=1 Tax=Setaria digitata TaxID=48799 RepID=A0A915PXB7_9BILA